MEISIPNHTVWLDGCLADGPAAIINNAYEDTRFYKEVDEMTGFQTRNLICTPLLDNKNNCLGTIQSLNKKGGDFTTDDLELLNLAARMVAVAINNSRQYNELLVTNKARRKFIKQIIDRSGNNFDKL